MKIIYSDGYDLNLGDHVFPSIKYRLARQRLIERGIAAERDFIQPAAASDEQVLLVHTPAYVAGLKNGTLSYEELLRLEVPYSRQFVEAVWLSAGGSIEAARRALADGICVNLGGGFHHAFPEHGEGFCALNDVAIAVRALQSEKSISTALVVDCDVHQGNGTAAIFHNDPSVFTLSIHQLNNYPFFKPPSDIDIDLPDRTGDEEYLGELSRGLDRAFAAIKPDLILYLAGADPYREDQLGGLALTADGLERRDRLVFRRAREKDVPVAVTLAGGYAFDLDDTIEIHFNTVKAADDLWRHP